MVARITKFVGKSIYQLRGVVHDIVFDGQHQADDICSPCSQPQAGPVWHITDLISNAANRLSVFQPDIWSITEGARYPGNYEAA